MASPSKGRSSYNTGNGRTFHSCSIFGSEMLFYCAFQIWELFPIEVQKVQSVAYFKKAINQCKSKICPCCLCRAQTFRLISCTQFMIREKKKIVYS